MTNLDLTFYLYYCCLYTWKDKYAEDTEGELCQKMDMFERARKLSMQSMPDIYSLNLEYEEKQEAELTNRLTIIVCGWVRNR